MLHVLVQTIVPAGFVNVPLVPAISTVGKSDSVHVPVVVIVQVPDAAIWFAVPATTT